MKLLRKLYEMFFVWHVPTRYLTSIETSPDPDVLIAVTFGMKGDKPGLSNETMAYEAARTSEIWEIPFLLQKEIAEALPPGVEPAGQMSGVYDGKYHDTSDTVSEAAAMCRKNGWKNVMVLGHPAHAWRVCRCAEKSGLTVVETVTTFDGAEKKIPYDPHSTQKWCRGPIRYLLYELLAARPVYLFTGKI